MNNIEEFNFNISPRGGEHLKPRQAKQMLFQPLLSQVNESTGKTPMVYKSFKSNLELDKLEGGSSKHLQFSRMPPG